MSEKICDNCAHYVTFVDGKGERIYGECRRYPPVALVTSGIHGLPASYTHLTLYPRPPAHDWCGEWKNREEDEP